MKKSIIILVMFVWVTQGYGGFFSSLMGSVVANDLSSSASRAYISPGRAKKINHYLWSMHEKKKYDTMYVHYLKELEKSTNIDYQDTLAWAYYDNNNSKKAVEIYEKHVMPWLRFESRQKRKRFERNYKKFTGSKSKVDYDKILQKYLSVEEVNSTTESKPDFALLKVQVAELQIQNSSLQSYKTFSLIMAVITLFSLGLVFVLLRGRKRE